MELIEYFYDYTAHVSLNAENGLITNLVVTSVKTYDGHHFRSLVDHDLQQQLPVETYAAYKDYDDSDNHYRLELHCLQSSIRLM